MFIIHKYTCPLFHCLFVSACVPKAVSSAAAAAAAAAKYRSFVLSICCDHPSSGIRIDAGMIRADIISELSNNLLWRKLKRVF
jgi:hypothetical protein